MEKRKFTDGEWRFVPDESSFAVTSDDGDVLCISADPEVEENLCNGKLFAASKLLHDSAIQSLKFIQEIAKDKSQKKETRNKADALGEFLTDAIYKARVGDE